MGEVLALGGRGGGGGGRQQSIWREKAGGDSAGLHTPSHSSTHLQLSSMATSTTERFHTQQPPPPIICPPHCSLLNLRDTGTHTTQSGPCQCSTSRVHPIGPCAPRGHGIGPTRTDSTDAGDRMKSEKHISVLSPTPAPLVPLRTDSTATATPLSASGVS